MKNKDEIIYILTSNQYILNDKELYVTFNLYANEDDNVIFKNCKIKQSKKFKFTKFKFTFDNNCIYKVKVRKSGENIYDLINVLDKNCNHQKIIEFKKRIDDGYSINYLDLKFLLDSKSSWYEAKKGNLDITISSKKDNIFELCDNKKILAKFLDKNFQEKITKEVANKMVDDANDWIDNDDTPNYTSDILYNSLKLTSIYISENDCNFDYDAGDIFGGHTLMVYIENFEIKDIDLVG